MLSGVLLTGVLDMFGWSPDNQQIDQQPNNSQSAADLNSSVYDTGLQGTPVVTKPVPKPRPRVIPSDEKAVPQVKPRPAPRVKPVPIAPKRDDSSNRNQNTYTVDNLPFYRRSIEELIKENRPQKEKFQAACSVMRVECSLNSKYENIELCDLLEKNKGQDVRKIPQAFTILEKYATNLLKDESQRHPSWKSIQFHSAAYQNKVKFMIGALDILKSLGYTEENYNNQGVITGVSFPPRTCSNSRIVLNIAVDLIIAQFEVEAMIMGEHPRAYELQTIEDVPSIYFPLRNLVQDSTTDNTQTGKVTVDYALNKPCPSLGEEPVYDVPPPALPPKKNSPQKPPVPEQSDSQCSTPTKSPSDDQNTGQIPCLRCGTILDAGFNFCSKCGSSLKGMSVSDDESKKDSLKTLSIDNDNVFVTNKEGWNCEHCTLLNSYDTNFCAACYRTSSVTRDRNVQKSVDTLPPNKAQVDDIKLREARKRMEEELQLKKAKELQEAEMKKQIILQEQNSMKENARLLVSLLKFCETHGYAVEECLLAQRLLNNLNEQLLLRWLQNDWLNLIDDVVKLCTEYFEKDEAIGAISRNEAKQLLLEAGGNRVEVVRLYAEQRKKKVEQMANIEKIFTRKDILSALFDAGGDDEKARELLHKKRLYDFYQNMNQKFSLEDYDRLRDENIPPEVKRRMVMVENGISHGRANFVFRLLNKDVPGTVMEIIEVIRNNTLYSYEQCIKFFAHECGTCFEEYSHNNIYVGLYCKCEYCQECYGNFIKVVISEKHIRNLVCPTCFKPDIEDPNIDTQHYFGMLAAQINDLINKGILEQKIKDIFDKKLLDFHLKRRDNFRYCIKCKNGFEWEDVNQIRMECDICKARMCFLCRELWLDQHDGTTCEDFKEWKEANDPDRQEKGVNELLHGRGIECPDCQARFELAQGGCMHFTCTECKYEFCSGCNQAFKRDGQCPVHQSCVGKGIHTHHPRDCLYYMRDFEVGELERLLNDNNVEWKKEYPPEIIESNNRVCGVALQKEIGNRLMDEPCGEVAPENMAGLCLKHYKEYLVVLINNNGIDPIKVMDVDIMLTVLQRAFKQPLEKVEGEADEQYKHRLLEHVLKEVPLPRRQKRRIVPVVAAPQQNENVLGAVAANFDDAANVQP